LQLLDLTLPTPAENIALDEALLELAEAQSTSPDNTSAKHSGEVLRLWMSPDPIVVIGRSSKIREEVDVDSCQRDGVTVLRRCSGGAAVVAGPGCLLYAVVLSYQKRPHLRSLDLAHREVMGTVAGALQTIDSRVTHRGVSDLTFDDRKCAGNSVRCKREHLLYHGAILYDLPLELIGDLLLPDPPRQPEYRKGRSHLDFVANLPTNETDLKAALATAWQADEQMKDWPQELTGKLAAEKYAKNEWTFKR